MQNITRSLTPSKYSCSPLLCIFIDGVGIGRPDRQINPLFAARSEILGFYQGVQSQGYRQGQMISTDATLGVAGRPQSATGQTALFTGMNAAAILGRHLNGFPSQRLKELLKDSIFRRAKDCGLTVSFANAYRPEYFTEPVQRVSATTSAFQQAGIAFRTFDDLGRGNALSHEFTRSLIRSRGYDFEPIEPEEAAGHLLDIFRQCDLLLYEFFMTDVVAHTQSMPDALALLEKLERFLKTVIDGLDFTQESLLITSDHGNFEDLSIRSHTLNPVATQVWGPAQHSFPVEPQSSEGVKISEPRPSGSGHSDPAMRDPLAYARGSEFFHRFSENGRAQPFDLTDVGPCVLRSLGVST